MNKEKILTPEEWYVKKYEPCHGYFEWANFDVEEYAEYYYEMKMKEILQKQEEEKTLRDYLNQCYFMNQKT